jgi:GDP/UDP-N,N'-diacetylbacillosamine 2-epimerase (hydrolysing)
MRGTINIGERQRGRLRAGSMIDSAADRQAVDAALQQLYSPEFQSRLPAVRNPYDEGGASARIIPIRRDYPLEFILKKTFYDLR